MLEVKSIDRLLGTPVSYAYAVKSGPWIFLTGHEAYDWQTGIPDEVAGPPGFPLYGRSRSRREGDFILQRMNRLLREFGSDLPTRCPVHELSIRRAACRAPYRSRRSTPAAVTRRKRSGRAFAWASISKAAATRVATLSASAALRA